MGIVLVNITMSPASISRPSVKITPELIDPDERNTFDIVIEGASNTRAFQLAIYYDASVITITDIALNDFWVSSDANILELPASIDNSEGKLTYGVFNIDTPFANNGTLATVTFSLKSQTGTNLEFDVNSSWIMDEKGEALPSEWVGASIISTKSSGLEEPDSELTSVTYEDDSETALPNEGASSDGGMGNKHDLEVIVQDCVYSDSAYIAPEIGTSEVHVLGVYETRSDHSFGYHPQGSADVNVKRKGKPMVLVLSSYEPTLWRIHKEDGVNIERIILNGYHNQEVEGAEDIPVLDRSGVGNYISACARAWPSSTGGCDTPGLVSGIEEITGTTIASFHGCYRAMTFTIKDKEDEEYCKAYYRDADGDGFGNPEVQIRACNAETPDGYVKDATDCDDNDWAERPGQDWYRDRDGDKFSDGMRRTSCERPEGYYLRFDLKSVTGDCDDNDPSINPGALEVCYNSIDDNCDAEEDNCDETEVSVFYPLPDHNTPPNLSLIGIPDKDSEEIDFRGGNIDGYMCDASFGSTGTPVITISDSEGIIAEINGIYDGMIGDDNHHGDPVESSSESLFRADDSRDLSLGGIVGYVHDGAYNVINDTRISITLKNERGNNVWVYYNDFIGIYYVPWLDQGRYTLNIEVSGYTPFHLPVSVGKKTKREDVIMSLSQ